MVAENVLSGETSSILNLSDAKNDEEQEQQNQDSQNKKRRGLRMSKIARDHLSDEKNPNNFPKLLGIEFPGKLSIRFG